VDPSDRELFDLWRTGDGAAGETLVKRHQSMLVGFFVRRVPHVASDLAQETWVQCLKSHEKYRGDASFRTFLFAIGHNVLRRYLRGTGRHDAEAPMSQMPDSLPSPASMLLRRLDLTALKRAIDELPPEYRLLVELTYENQLDSVAVGEMLDMPSATVRTRLRRARELLRDGVERATGREGGEELMAILGTLEGDSEIGGNSANSG